jgi:hypothetical protein
VIDYPGSHLPADVTWPRIGASMLGIPIIDLEDRTIMLPDHLTKPFRAMLTVPTTQHGAPFPSAPVSWPLRSEPRGKNAAGHSRWQDQLRPTRDGVPIVRPLRPGDRPFSGVPDCLFG